jgi:diguanylate cyclase (GGDEF)-like protein/PAS domain S-box-containing protein
MSKNHVIKQPWVLATICPSYCWILSGLVTAILILSLFASADSQALTTFEQSNSTAKDSSPATQTPNRTLVVGSEEDYPPFATGITDETAGGFTVDLWKAIAAESGLKYTIHVLPFRQVLQEFKDGKIDVLINLAISDERRQFADFTVPHVIVNGAVFVRKGESAIRSEDDFVGKSIIVLNGDLGQDYAVSKGWKKQLILVDTAAEGLRLLASGKHDTMLLSKLTGMQTLQAQGLTNIEALKVKAGFSQKFAFAVHKGQSDLLSSINEGMAITKADGTYNTLYEKWFGIYEVKEVGLRDMLTYIIPMALVFIIIGGYLFYLRQRERRASEAELRTLFTAINQSPASVIITGLDARIQYVNPKFIDVTGYSSSEAIGQNPRILKSGQTAQDVYLQLWDKLCNGQPWHGELINKRKNGEVYWEDVHIAPVKSLAGAVTHYVAVKTDITDRKKVEKALKTESEMNLALLRNASDGIHILNMEGNVIEASDAFCRMLGYQREEVIGMNVSQWDDVFEKSEMPKIIRQHYAHQRRVQFDTRHQRKDGTFLDVEVSGFPLLIEENPVMLYSSRDITERKKNEWQLAQLNLALNHVKEAAYLMNENGRFLYVNEEACRVLGYTREELIGGMGVPDIGEGWTKEMMHDHWQDIKANGTRTLEALHRARDGHIFPVEVSANYIEFDGQGYNMALVRDITERKTAEAKLRTLSTAIEQIPVSVVITDLEANIEYVNPRFTEVTGYTAEEAIGQNPRILQSGLTPQEIHLELWNKVVNGQIWHGELINKRKNGEIYWDDVYIAPVRDDSGVITNYVATKVDITERKSMEEKVRHLAQYDVLTDLPNRSLFSDRLQQALAIAKRDKKHLALMFIDLDKFKPVNDEFGHQMGDLLLKDAAKRMLDCVRESDTIARIGGDEFVVLLPTIETEEDALRVAEKIRHALNKPFALLGNHLCISSSTGIVVYPEHGTNEEELFKNADDAMYSAKAGGRNAAILFSESMRDNP